MHHLFVTALIHPYLFIDIDDIRERVEGLQVFLGFYSEAVEIVEGFVFRAGDDAKVGDELLDDFIVYHNRLFFCCAPEQSQTAHAGQCVRSTDGCTS